ncbi:hypothetical protein D8L92_06645 [Capnocytophaga canimorsus]|nr:hypothetical protein D8L92_06645 [Capnocytophaga canimorsus]
MVYSLVTDPLYFKEQNVNIQLGTTVRAIDTDFNLNDDLRVIRLTKDLQNPYNVQFEVAERAEIAYIVLEYFEAEKAKIAMVQADKFNAEMARRAYRFGKEISDNVFDGEGYFNAEKIKPLSIETKLLSVGSRMQQFALPDVVISVENATTVSNTQGKIVHLTLEEHPREWQIPANTQTGITEGFNYVYIKAQRIGSNASVFVSPEKISVDSDVAFYHFEAGYLGSVESGNRRIRMSHGFTQINPFEITTGRIAPPSGDHYIELLHDRINIVGNLHITDGNINQIKQSISPDLLSLENRLKAFSEQKVNGLQIGGRNLLRNSNKSISNRDYLIATYDITQSLKEGEQVTVTLKGELGAGKVAFAIYNSGGSVDLATLINKGNGIHQATFNWKIGVSNNKFLNVYTYYSSVVTTSSIEWIQLEKGTKATDWSPAPEDLQAQITAEQQARQTAIDQAKTAAEAYARAQADLAKTLAIAQADNNISQAEQRQIANATQKLQEAKTFAEQKVNELQISSQNIYKGILHLYGNDYNNSDNTQVGRIVVTGGRWNSYAWIKNAVVSVDKLSYEITNRPVSAGIYVKAPAGMKLGIELVVDYYVNPKGIDFIGTGYWQWVKIENTTKADANTGVLIGLYGKSDNTILGEVFYKDFAIVFGNKAPEGFSPNPQDIEKDLQHAKTWADMLDEAEKANVKKISEIFKEQDNFVDGTSVVHNTIATGAVMVGNITQGGNAGINGSGNNTTDVRFWAGANFANRANAPFRVLDNGEVHATNAHISGHIEATSGRIGGQWEGIRINTNGTVDIGSINSSDDNDSYFLGNHLGTDILSFKNQEGMGFPKTFRSETTAQGIEVTRRYNSTTLGVRHTHFGLQGVFSRFSDNRVFSDAYVGQAKTDVIEKYIGATKSFVFTSVSSFITVNLPSISQINEAYGNVADISFRLEIVCAHTMHDRIRIQGVVGGYLLDNNANRFSGGNGQLDMGKGDILLLRYYNHNYYVISHRN